MTLIGILLIGSACSTSGVGGTPPTAALGSPGQVPPTEIPSGRVETDITYCQPDGLDLYLDLYYPPQEQGRYATLVFLHGGSWRSGSKAEVVTLPDFPSLQDAGYLIASVDYRLAPAYKFPAQIEDVKCAVRFLKANAGTYQIDPNRIGAIGTDAGGHLAALLGVTSAEDGLEGSGGYPEFSSSIKLVIAFSPPIFLSQNNPGMTAQVFEEVFGVSSGQTGILLNATPLHYVDRNDSAFLVFHGDSDQLITKENSIAFTNQLRQAGTEAFLVLVQNGGHDLHRVTIDTIPSREQITRILLDFLNEQFQP